MKKEISSNLVSSPKGGSRALILFQKIQSALLYLPDFGKTCKAILDAVIDEVDAENCSLMLMDPVSGELRVRAARGRNDKETIYYSDGLSVGKRFRPASLSAMVRIRSNGVSSPI